MEIVLISIFPLLLNGLDSRESPDSLYARISPAVIAVESSVDRSQDSSPAEGNRRGRLRDSYFGTGVVIHPSGLVLTSIRVVPDKGTDIRVLFPGGARVKAERLLSVPEKELVLLQLNPGRGKPRGPFPFIRLGNSDELHLGLLAFALGNAFRSIMEDHQVSFAAGAISGTYTLTEKLDQSLYVGPTIETTAAVNDGMDGGALVNSRGELVGLLSLNYSPSRRLGTAIPINFLKPHLAEKLGWFGDRWERHAAHLGLELAPARLVLSPPPGSRDGNRAPERSVVIAWVQGGSPAERAGIRKGDVLTHYDGGVITNSEEFRDYFKKARGGDRVELGIKRGSEEKKVRVTLWGNF